MQDVRTEARLSVTGDLTALRRFLDSRKCLQIGAKQAHADALRDGLTDLMKNENVMKVISELKAALCENGWLMGLLAQHMQDAECAEAWKVVV